MKYSILIEWSDEDNTFVVSLPEWGPFAHTHGDTYQEALENALTALDVLGASRKEQGRELPQPHTFNSDERIKAPEGAGFDTAQLA